MQGSGLHQSWGLVGSRFGKEGGLLVGLFCDLLGFWGGFGGGREGGAEGDLERRYFLGQVCGQRVTGRQLYRNRAVRADGVGHP